MRLYLAAALVVASVAVAQDTSPFLKGEELQAEIVKNCGDGCITFSPAEMDRLQEDVEEFARKSAQQAYEMGKADQKSRCASLI